MERETHIIDAKDRPLGRLAVEIAVILRGKHKESFAPHKDAGDFVVVKNIGSISFTGKKKDEKIYYRHTGYLGGLKEKPLKKLSPEEVLKKAVFGMVPNNKLRQSEVRVLRSRDSARAARGIG